MDSLPQIDPSDRSVLSTEAKDDPAESQLHVHVLCNALLDSEIVVDDARRELNAVNTQLDDAIGRRDDLWRRLERAIAECRA